MNFHPVANIFPLLDGAEFDALVADIAEHGQREAIWLHPDGSILDGRNRYRACAELGLAPEYRQWEGEPGEELDFVVSLNLHRRHMTPSQLSILGAELEPMYAEQAKTRQGQRTDLGLTLGQDRPNVGNNGRAAQQAAQAVGVGKSYVKDAKRLMINAPDLANEVRAGTRTLQEAKREMTRRDRDEVRNTGNVFDPLLRNDSYLLRCGDFRSLAGDIPDNSVDFIFTDPPYDAGSIPLYGDLARIAQRILRPGGSLMAYAGHYALPQLFEIMTPHLRYWWICSVDHSGNSARLPGKWVFVGWKPIIWFVKESLYKNDYVADKVKSAQPDKVHHEWQQDESEARYYIEHLTQSGQVVYDPFMGSGTTGLSAIALGRRFIGHEMDEARYNVAAGRLTNAHR